MKVESFEFYPGDVLSGPSGDEKITNRKLWLNGQEISTNLPYLAFEDEGLLQVEVCKGCNVPGCTKGGYVQLLKAKGLIIWKEPLISEPDNFTQLHYSPARALKNGSIFWTKEYYDKFAGSFNSTFSQKLPKDIPEITPKQGLDLWRIYGSRHLCPDTNYSLEIEEIQNRLLYLFSTKFNRVDCLKVFEQAKQDYLNANRVNILEIPYKNKEVTVLSVRQFDYLCNVENRRLYPVGENYAVEFK